MQVSAFVEAGIMDMPKTMSIFAHYIYAIYTRACVAPDQGCYPG